MAAVQRQLRMQAGERYKRAGWAALKTDIMTKVVINPRMYATKADQK
jgi:hypothetical protein